jgi:hypothetical protein
MRFGGFDRSDAQAIRYINQLPEQVEAAIVIGLLGKPYLC